MSEQPPEPTPAPAAEPEPVPAVDVVDPSPEPAPDEPATSAEPASSMPVGAVTAQGDVMRRRTDDDVLTGGFATLIRGPYQGRTVVLQQTVTRGPDGYPDQVIVKTRDDRDEPLLVHYENLRPATAGGR